MPWTTQKGIAVVVPSSDHGKHCKEESACEHAYSYSHAIYLWISEQMDLALRDSGDMYHLLF